MAAVALALPSARQQMAGRRSPEGFDPALRYRYERSSRGTVVRALQAEIAFYQARISRDPQGGLDLAALGGAYLKMARATGDLSWYLLSEQAAQRALANLPFNNEGAVLVLARVAEARHDFAEAIRLARRAAGHQDAVALLVTTNLAKGAVPDAERAAEVLLLRSPSLGAYTLRALVRTARGEDDAAMADLQRGIALEEPGEVGASVLARTRLGRLYYKRGRLAEAEALYVEALRILSQYPLALIYLAELETRTGRYAQAQGHLEQIVTISAASPNVYDHVVFRGVGRLRMLERDLKGGEELWALAEARLRKDVAEGSFGHRREMARLLLERGRAADVPEALRLMAIEVKLRRDADTLDTYAWALSAVGRYDKALNAITEALRWGSRDPVLLYRAGKIYEAMGDTRRARAFFEDVRRVDPSFNDHAWRASGFGD